MVATLNMAIPIYKYGTSGVKLTNDLFSCMPLILT